MTRSATVCARKEEEARCRLSWRTSKARKRLSRQPPFCQFATCRACQCREKVSNDSADLSWVMLENGVGYIYVRRITQGLEPGLDRAIKGLAGMKGPDHRRSRQQRRSIRLVDRVSEFRPLTQRAAESKRPFYRGPIAPLIDERTISAGEGWASWFIANKRSRVFGTTTAGASSRKETYTLTNGLYKVVVPVKAYTGFLDRPIERRGLEPDVEVQMHCQAIWRKDVTRLSRRPPGGC